MATYKCYLDSRLKKDGTAHLKVIIYAGQRQQLVSLGLCIPPEMWDKEAYRVKPAHPLHRQLNMHIRGLLLLVDEALLTLPPGADIKAAVKAVKAVLRPGEPGPKEEGRNGLLMAVERFMGLKREVSTRRSYGCLLTHLERFRPEATLDEVNKTWLQEFDAHLARSAPSPNARAIYMRNLRAVYNFAIDEELTNNYPFRRYHIKTIATAKRSLSVEQMHRLMTMEVEERHRAYRDFFVLSFLLIGTNPKDLLHLPAGADAGGRIIFHRAKTKKLYSIRIEPEAQAIIERYRGRDHLLVHMDGRADYLQWLKQCNHALQRIGTESHVGCATTGTPLFAGLTSYWARHTWASIAAELDIPKETIAAALGHDMGNSTTAIYINYNQAKVDEANRRVIDKVLSGC